MFVLSNKLLANENNHFGKGLLSVEVSFLEFLTQVNFLRIITNY